MQPQPMNRPSRRISTWKEIASFLGVSTRTAQQWERTRGLPVYRVRGGLRGSVYAFQEELEAWLQGPGQGLHEEAPPPRPWRIYAGGLAALLLAAALLAAAWPRLRARWVRPVSARFESEVLVALDEQGREVWRRRPEPPADLPSGVLDMKKSKAVLADLNGDGAREVVAVEAFESGSPALNSLIRRELLSCTSPSGRLLWRRAPDCGLLDAEGRRFTSDWDVHALLASGAPGRERVYVALGHRNRFPGVVAEVERDGALKMVFANHGHVNSLAAVEAGGKHWLVAGGATNALKGGFLALLDPAAGFSKAPEGGPARYRMANPAGNGPAAYYHIPLADLTAASLSEVNHVYHLERSAEGVVARVLVGGSGWCMYYLEFALPLEPRVVRVTAACGLEHRQHEKRGDLDHPFEKCPFFQQPLELHRWRPGEGWTTVRVPVATMRNTI